MSVRVNLLPAATKDRERATRQRSMLGGSFLVLLVLLGLLYWLATNQVGTARDELAVEEARTAELRRDVGELGAFRDLQQHQERSNLMLQEALAGEVSLAGILQDLAMVMPAEGQFENLTLTFGADSTPNGSEEGLAVGTFNATGRTANSHAPGVERFLLELDKMQTFQALHLPSSALDDPDDPAIDAATFTLTGEIGSNAVTHRYRDGLPEELR